MEFDPYYEWLGIPPHEHPISHYRLLGIQDGEHNPKVIENAADKAMVFLRHHAAGSKGKIATKLLNEVSNARIVLLDQQKKAEYDRQFRRAEPQITSRPPAPILPPMAQKPGEMPVRNAPPAMLHAIDCSDIAEPVDLASVVDDEPEPQEFVKEPAPGLFHKYATWILLGAGIGVALVMMAVVFSLLNRGDEKTTLVRARSTPPVAYPSTPPNPPTVNNLPPQVVHSAEDHPHTQTATQFQRNQIFTFNINGNYRGQYPRVPVQNAKVILVYAGREIDKPLIEGVTEENGQCKITIPDGLIDEYIDIEAVVLVDNEESQRFRIGRVYNRGGLNRWNYNVTLPLPEEYTNELGMRFRLVKKGRFVRNSPDSGMSNPRAYRRREISITEPFYLGVYEVTQEQYQNVMGKVPNPSYPSHPVRRVPRGDALKFLLQLSRQEYLSYRLPTEAQWEYACRADDDLHFDLNQLAKSIDDYAWFGENSGGMLHSVGQKKPNSWGFYDMRGNVSEWCSDWFDSNYYKHGFVPMTNPTGPTDGQEYTVRGGNVESTPDQCLVHFREGKDQYFGDDLVGFRAVLLVTGLERKLAKILKSSNSYNSQP